MIELSNIQILECDEFGKPHHEPEYLDLAGTWSKIFDYPMPSPIQFVAAGHLCISKERVQIKPKSFYENIVKILEEDPMAPWCIERFEIYIFT